MDQKNADGSTASWQPNVLDARMAVSVLVCILVATILSSTDLTWPVGEAHLEVIQKMTACISCLLCCQDGLMASKGAGLNRVVVTMVGGLVGVAVTALDVALGGNPWTLVLLVPVGTVLTLCLCRLAGVPAFNARIGGITFILVSCTLTGTLRIWYAAFRLVSTVFAALVVLCVTWLFELAQEKSAGTSM